MDVDDRFAPVYERAQIDIEAMRGLGKAGIIEKAIEEVRKKRPDYSIPADHTDYCRVLASQRTIRVVLQPVFMAMEEHDGHTVHKEDLEVSFTKENVSIQPHEFVHGFNALDDAAQKMLTEVLKQKTPQVDERLTICMKDGAIEVQVSRGYSGGTERYRIDPQDGKWNMLWHEHPMPPMQMGKLTVLHKDGTSEVVEDEVFNEIK